ncbi:MAG: metallophosphatase family protein [Thaumarchaeota archaeon]|nr:metallophosphatase family protein [Nitrososphaerota archaeon]
MAVVSDVHSNLEALEEVLSEAGDLPLYCLGDIVGYGANPNEVVELLRRKTAVSVMGNHDYAAVTADTGMFNARAAMAANWTTRELTGRSLGYLRTLPRQVTLEVGGVRAVLTHGSPDDALWEYVHPVTHSQLFGYYLSKLEAGLLGLGHTHIPFVWKGKEGTVFNPGSVGQPRDGDRRASFAVVRTEGESVSVQVRRVEYDYERAAAKIREKGLPEQNASRLSKGT